MAFLLMALALAGGDPPLAKVPPEIAAPPEAMRELLQNCDAHKFETTIAIDNGGIVKHSRVKLCGTEGQSDADWVRTLKDAVAKTAANDKMPASARNQIVSAIKAEIARLEGAAPATAVAALPPPRSAAAKSAPLDGYAALPPLPATPPAPVHVLTGVSAALPSLPMPKLSFSCFTPASIGEGPCTEFSRDTLMTVRAGEDLPAGTSLQFVRSGEARADVKLAELKRGKSVRFPLPSDVCSHAAGGRLEIVVLRTVPAANVPAQEVGRDGPYNLRC